MLAANDFNFVQGLPFVGSRKGCDVLMDANRLHHAVVEHAVVEPEATRSGPQGISPNRWQYAGFEFWA
jgi:hypothetical protein